MLLTLVSISSIKGTCLSTSCKSPEDGEQNVCKLTNSLIQARIPRSYHGPYSSKYPGLLKSYPNPDPV